MTKFEMRELAAKMERYPDQFAIEGEDDDGDPMTVACGVQAGTHEWDVIVEALKAAGAQ